jgi:hypothetical protein
MPFSPVVKKSAKKILEHHASASLKAAYDELANFERENLPQFTQYHVVFLTSTSPSPAIRGLFSNRRLRPWISYIQGSSLSESDLRRCGVRKAAACFVIADRSKGNISDDVVIDEEQRNVLRVWSVRKFASNTPVYVYNLRYLNLREI